MHLKQIFLLCLLTVTNLSAFQDPVLSEVIVEHLATMPKDSTPQQKAFLLTHQIDRIAQEALKRGMDISSYESSLINRQGATRFIACPVWEGGTEGIPLTFFIYAWPNEQKSLRSDPLNKKYASCVHSHGLTCALTVLKGTLIQENYEKVAGYDFNVAKKLDETLMHPGDKEVDDLTSPFVHRIVNRDPSEEDSYSMHVYGEGSAEDVWRRHDETHRQCVYLYILKDDGTVQRR